MRIYNVMHGKLEEFVPIKPNEVSLYVCGPTVYNHIHIGNARPVVFFDTVRRYFEFLGYQVKYVSNITDVNDKIFQKASELGIDEFVHANNMTESYLEEIKQLNVLDFSKLTKVVEYMDAIIVFIEELMEKDFAYKAANGDIYFRVSKIKDYGKLSGQLIDELISGSRVSVNEFKENPLDFVLWKSETTGHKFEAKFGDGRPGWHTECICMIKDTFGGKIDIHGGGQDLRFPHHENEIAQSEAIYNDSLANYWMHNNRLDFENKKMSKSLGNLIWLKDAIEQYGGDNVRFMLIQSHYRQKINYSDSYMDLAIKEVDKFKRINLQVFRHLDHQKYLMNDLMNERLILEFKEAMDNDFNTNNALTVIYKAVKELNLMLRNNADLSEVCSTYNAFIKMLEILGLEFTNKKMSDEEREIYDEWLDAKNKKDFLKADSLRDELIQKELI